MPILRCLGRLLFTVVWTALIAALAFTVGPHVVSELGRSPWPVVAFWCVFGPVFVFAALASVLQMLRWVVTGRNGPRIRWNSTGGG